ncbi:hypothetical protein QE152_g23137 [Popillia japonica]|uniref:Reverse transcriptase n=1 Tax=Popillia japonica TaxID=7064 RepID=A0AAW1KIB2_POPJA
MGSPVYSSVGPKLQEDLFDIVARFRIHKYVLTADIAKMYRQVMVKKEHTPFQRILWRENQTDEIKTYELKTVTYGTASASYLAIKALQQLAQNQVNIFPLEVILRDFYVDDLLTGADTLADAMKIRQEVVATLSCGKMELRKWASNEPSLLKDLSNSSNSHVVLSADKGEDINTLGLLWNSKSDILQYSTVSEPSKNFIKTKYFISNIKNL